MHGSAMSPRSSDSRILKSVGREMALTQMHFYNSVKQSTVKESHPRHKAINVLFSSVGGPQRVGYFFRLVVSVFKTIC
jgi:hypothetical protein